MKIRNQVLWAIWIGQIALIPVITRTPMSGLVGGKFAYTLWTDFLFGFLVLALFIEGRLTPLQFRSCVTTRWIQFAFLLLVMSRYTRLLLSGLTGEPVLIYLFSGSIWVQAYLAFLLGQMLPQSDEQLKQIRWCFFAGFGIVAMIGLLELARVPVIIDFLNTRYGTETHAEAAQHLALIDQFRLTSTMDRNPHGLAMMMMMGLTWGTALVLSHALSHRLSRLFPMVFLPIALVLLIGTMSTLGLAATTVAVGSVVLPHLRARKQRTILLVAGLGLSLFLILQQIESTSIAKLTTIFQMLSGGEQGPGSLRDRLEVWTQIIQRVSESPDTLLIGIPFHRITALFDAMGHTADSDYMNVLLYQGVIGLAAFLALYGFFFHGIQRALASSPPPSSERRALLLAARGILLGVAVAGLAGGFTTSAGTAWRIGFLVFSLLGAALAPSLTTEHA